MLDRAEASLDRADQERRVLLDAVAAGVELINAVPASVVAGRRRAARERAQTDASAPPELLAVAAFIAVVTNEPAAEGAELALRALTAGGEKLAKVPRRPWFSHATWFAQTAVSFLVAERYDELRPLLDESIAQARATGDSGILAIGLALRGWLAFRLGDLIAAEIDTRLRSARRSYGLRRSFASSTPAFSPARCSSRVSWPRRRRCLRLSRARSKASRLRRPCSGLLVVACESRRDESMKGSPTFWPSGGWQLAQMSCVPVTSHGDRKPLSLTFPSRSASLPSGLPTRNSSSAERSAPPRPRNCEASRRARGGRGPGLSLLREAVAAFERSDARLERRARLPTSARCSAAQSTNRRSRTPSRRPGHRPPHRGATARRAPEIELRASGGRPRRIFLSGLDSLTASERRIAELASQGLSNREIAQTLFVTNRTVEGHLTNVFRKLHVDSRTKLEAALAERSESQCEATVAGLAAAAPREIPLAVRAICSTATGPLLHSLETITTFLTYSLADELPDRKILQQNALSAKQRFVTAASAVPRNERPPRV